MEERKKLSPEHRAKISAALKGNRNSRKHGHGSPGRWSLTYISWVAMRTRCANANHISYKNYGGRGISICNRWAKFENFLEDMGERPEGTSIDRIDSNGNYEPDNCQWATQNEQHKNKRTRTE